jgi:hypothetical protein
MRTEVGGDDGKCSVPLGPWRSPFIFVLNMQFLCNNLISVSACYSKINRRLLLQ